MPRCARATSAAIAVLVALVTQPAEAVGQRANDDAHDRWVVLYGGWSAELSSVDYGGPSIGSYIVQRYEHFDWRMLSLSLVSFDNPSIRAATGVNLYSRGGHIAGVAIGVTEWSINRPFVSAYLATEFRVAERAVVAGLEIEGHRTSHDDPGALASFYLGLPVLR